VWYQVSVSDRKAAGLRGPVARCESEHIEHRFITRESYRRDAQWSEQWHRNPDGSEWSAVRQFDADGRVLVEQRHGSAPQTLAFRYDAKQRLMRVDKLDPDDTERIQESHLYGEDGTSTVTLYIDPPLLHQNVSVLSEHMLHVSLDAACIMTMRDSAGTETKKVFYDSDNRVIKRVLFRYDAAGRLVEEGEVESGSRLRADMRNLYEYDRQGNRIAAEMHWGDLGGQRKTISYTELGDLKEVRIAPLAGEVDLGETAPWATHYSYEYDPRGNWTSRTEQIRRLDSGLVTHTGVMRRTLEYWD
jgi:hypothetical protein